MFGYIKPLIPELRVRELEYYRSAYCGMCGRMGKECGTLSRLCLSYDLTFLSLLIMTLTGEKNKIEKHGCPANCFVSKKMTVSSPATDYAAAACAALASFGFADDVRDEKGARRAFSSMAEKASEKWLSRSEKLYPGLTEGLRERLQALNAAEENATAEAKDANGTASSPADVCSALFGEVLSFLFSFPFSKDESDSGHVNKAIASAVGNAIGRWIYIVDATDDLKKDEKRERFNPLLISYGASELTDDEKTTLRCNLAALAGQAQDALLLCDRDAEAPSEPYSIIMNILSGGMKTVAQAVLDGSYDKPARDKV
ncbi:MAG: DUF5685 family protein [Clostridia bacterium]|nr:DUF5685 family protein [Clostridia bacterium]